MKPRKSAESWLAIKKVDVVLLVLLVLVEYQWALLEFSHDGGSGEIVLFRLSLSVCCGDAHTLKYTLLVSLII